MAIQGGEPLQLGPWARGVFYNLPPEDVPADGLAEMENVRIGQAGQGIKRPGCASYQSAAALSGDPAPTLTLACEFEPTPGTTHVVIAAGAALYKYSSGWSAITGSTTITAGNDNVFEWANANGTLVICNGVDDAAIKWTGSGNAAALDVDARFTKPAHVAWWDDRLWMGNVSGTQQRVWYSNKGDPETWDATDFKSIAAPVTALVPLDEMLAAHTKTGIWTITPTGNTQIPYEIKQVIAGRGALSGRSVVTLPGRRQLFVYTDGIYRWSERDGKCEKVSFQLDEGYWAYLVKGRLPYSFALHYPDENETWFALPYSAGQTKMNHLVVYGEYEDDDAGEQYRWCGPWKGGTAYERNCAGLVAAKPHMGGFDGIFYDMDTGTNDVSTAVAAWFTTGAPAPTEQKDTMHHWLFVRTFFDPVGEYPVTVTQAGTDLVGNTDTFMTTSGAFILGSSYLGDALSSRRMGWQDSKLLGFGANMNLKYNNAGAGQTFTIRRAHIHHRLLGQRRKQART